ncbi:acetyl-CoA carboxylase biotin carboxyl carrier protein [Telmatospirillum siberiense]|uniref:Biotin carboxyl carrier protein of acetyl-CoA carboxylase n=1 Tax=Telmatospirillum siberiense TaxID=382514 RepID=A0A2N3PWT7_9PROT|nr:acetyl-CoA carboxylase biotin carboxyl carrier protein subunit [Telmatospirillum siberiense]PKU24845.1 acetyl-CoA carboxylase biotin carboxyl carrier protein [Telmatospirillum siberiense]
MAKTPIDGELIRSLATLLDDTHLTEIEYEAGGLRIRVARNVQQVVSAAPATIAPSPAATASVAPAPGGEDPANHPGAVKSPMVGVAYLLPEPDAPRFVNVGDTVVEGQTLLLIEAMKTFNTIRATRNGKVTAILIENGQPVEFGEPLMIIG